jgi:seryl-tRNA synthetase
MLSRQFILANAAAVRQNCVNRKISPDLVDRLIALEQQRQQCQKELETLRRRQNQLARDIGKSKKGEHK